MSTERALNYALFASVFVLMFTIGRYIAMPKRATRAAPHARLAEDESLVVEYARQHPDPAINGPFADKLSRGDIRVAVEKPTEEALASIGPVQGKYVLTIDPKLLKTEPTQDELEDVFSVLSHEHEHYLQFTGGLVPGIYDADSRLTEARCAFTVLVETDAYMKECRDALAFGWRSSVARDSCVHSQDEVAKHMLKHRARAFPECTGIWNQFINLPSIELREKVPVPRKVRSGQRTPIYLPPP